MKYVPVSKKKLPTFHVRYKYTVRPTAIETVYTGVCCVHYRYRNVGRPALAGEELGIEVYLELKFVLSLGIMLYCVTALRHVCNFLWASGYYMYRQFNIQQIYVLPTQCIYVFCVDLRKNSLYFPLQH